VAGGSGIDGRLENQIPGETKKLRKIVTMILMGAMLFFAPSTIPMKAVKAAAVVSVPCGTRLLWLQRTPPLQAPRQLHP
jgi:hypothetical protein